jgi:hypothetical protein
MALRIMRYGVRPPVLRRVVLRGFLTLILATSVLCPAFGHTGSTTPSPGHEDKTSKTRLGFWTYGTPLSRDLKGSSRCIDDEMLRRLGDAGVYLVYGLKKKDLGDELVDKLTRCKICGVEVHVSVTPMAEEAQFVNIWTFESLKGEIEEVLSFLRSVNLLGDPVTALVYDMEPLVGKQFPFYGMDWAVMRKLASYRAIETMFTEFNEHVRTEYHLNIRICSSAVQAIDPGDGDNDLACLFGLMSDDHASMSYMAYRRDDFGRDYIRAHCRLLNDGDTIILNAWKNKEHRCWGDLPCAIDDARLVLGCADKNLNVEIWELWCFLKSYGVQGLSAFVDAVSTDPFQWPPIEVRNEGLRSLAWDLLFKGVYALDFFGPLFRVILSAY